MTDTELKQTIDGMSNLLGTPIRSPLMYTPEEYGLAYEEVFFPAMDGLRLEGWFFPADYAEHRTMPSGLVFSGSRPAIGSA